jgi:hypothetical protein
MTTNTEQFLAIAVVCLTYVLALTVVSKKFDAEALWYAFLYGGVGTMVMIFLFLAGGSS